ncbi:spore cortex-lytic germination protein SleC [Romboutsia sp. 13368]|uniref:spore cortex-lytic germination protein SleC n=1 Tax=Romboutsia sp. 13368 TaxID=2708053 RepID=UPI0025DC3F7E|nr:spore cortex-lytic germination protein SleC [Romboutsia sp. 13368]
MPNGFLTVSVIDNATNRPIENAIVNIYTAPESGQSQTQLYQNLTTNNSGQVTGITLDAPDIQYSQQPSDVRPYSQYRVEVIAEGYETVIIDGTQVFPTIESRQNVPLNAQTQRRHFYSRQNENVFNIPENTLFGTFPPKIPESDLKPLPPPTGFVVLDNPVVPEFVIVHDGLPDDNSAPNYWIPFKEYIKNVASSEIYSTWPEQTIYANVIAIISFTLNRVFTEWYRSKGLNFTITSSTAYDHKFINNRNIFDTISVVVDNIFNTFIKRPPTARQPLLAQYCDGKNSQCPNEMTQWGSKDLGDQGMDYQSILRYFYGDEITFNTAPVVSGVPVSYPGDTLQVGSSGKDVRTIQNQLNAISNSYPAIPKVREDGVYGNSTAEAVRTFQGIFGLPQSGVVDFKTWYEISRIYVAVTKIASLNPKI